MNKELIRKYLGETLELPEGRFESLADEIIEELHFLPIHKRHDMFDERIIVTEQLTFFFSYIEFLEKGYHETSN